MAEAQLILQKALPDNTPIVSNIQILPDNFFNALYLLTTTTSFSKENFATHSTSTIEIKYILKISPPPETQVLLSESQLLSAEASLLHLLSEKPTENGVKESMQFPTSKIILYDDTCTIISSPYLLLSYLPGVPLSQLRSTLTVEEETRIDRSIGAYLRVLTLLPPSTPTHYGRATANAATYRTWCETFSNLFSSVLRDGESVMVSLPYEKLRQQLQTHSSSLEDVVTPRLAVLDFSDDSVLINPESKEITGLIDFERAVWGDALFCLHLFRMHEVGSEVFGTDTDIHNPRGNFSRTGAGSRALATGFHGDDDEGGILRTVGQKKRALLYSAYYSCTIIVGAYFHGAYADREMEERRQLVRCLEALERLKDDSGAVSLEPRY